MNKIKDKQPSPADRTPHKGGVFLRIVFYLYKLFLY